MNLKGKIGVAAGALLIAGSVMVGSVLAAEPNTPTDSTGTAQTAPASKLSQAAQDVLKQVQELRKSVMDKLKTDEQALVDQAVKDGKITQDEGTKLMQHGRHGGPGMMKEGRGGHGPGPGMKGGAPLTQDELKAKLAEAVTAGKMTQEQADAILAGGGAKFGHADRGGFGFLGEKIGADQVKAMLDAQVKSGKMTQEQADQWLQWFNARPATAAGKAQ
jgi:polyhydroxyalkanoate synthesis regulator phasin